MILTPDRVYRANGLNIKEFLLTEHNPNNIMMPTAKLPEKILGITVHNTGWINVSSNTTPAEQYTRATMNNNMGTVRVHFYVDDKCAWQNLPLTLSSFHAADGSGPGNRKTISIECIMRNSSDSVSLKSEDNCAKLVAYLLDKYGLTVDNGLYTHTHWLNVRDGKKGNIDELNTMKNSYKMCPLYILPHWDNFKQKVQKELDKIQGKTDTTVVVLYRVRKTWDDAKSQIGAYSSLENAKKACKEGYSVFDENGKAVYTVEAKPVSTPEATQVVKPVETPAAKPVEDKINVKYRAYAGGKWWGEIENYNTTNSNGYAGVEGKPIRGLAVKPEKGVIKYRVHIKCGGWLGWMTGYDINNWRTGCAGNKTRDIDAVQMDFSGVEGYEIRYRVSTTNSKNYLNWIEGFNTKNSNGYAGIIGRSIDKIQVEIIKK